jgi:hypothetical protein
MHVIDLLIVSYVVYISQHGKGAKYSRKEAERENLGRRSKKLINRVSYG